MDLYKQSWTPANSWIEQGEVEAVRSFQSPEYWTVHSAYQVETVADDNFPDGVPVVKFVYLDRPREYYPMGHHELPFELAKVRRNDESATLEFVSKWGLLGFDRLISGAGLKHRLGDPLDFIWWHAETIRNVLRIYEALKSEEFLKLRQVLDEVSPLASPLVQPSVPGPYEPRTNFTGDPLFERTFTGITLVEFKEERSTTLGEEDHESDTYFALSVIDKFIHGNISGIQPMMYMKGMFRQDLRPLDQIALGFTFTSLIEGIWWHLARYVTDQRDIAICKYCGHYFERTDKRQQFCPPPPEHRDEVAGSIRRRAQSLCANRYRLKKHRSKPS